MAEHMDETPVKPLNIDEHENFILTDGDGNTIFGINHMFESKHIYPVKKSTCSFFTL